MIKEHSDIMIKGGTIVTMDEKRRIIRDGSVVIRKNIIAAVGKTDYLTKKYSSDVVLNAKGKVIMPGLINCHQHTQQSLMKSLVYGELLGPSIYTEICKPFEIALTKKEAYISALLSCIESIKAGVTCLTDPGAYPVEEIANAVKETGMRAILSKWLYEPDVESEVSYLLPATLKDSLKFLKKWNGKADGRIRVWFAPFIMTNTDEEFLKTKELAEKYGVGVQTHLSQVREEVDYSLKKWQKRPVEHLEDIGFLGPNVLTAHMIFLSDKEIDILKRHDVKVVHCPTWQPGYAKVPLMLERGLTVSLGCDTHSSDIFDMMRIASFIHRYHWGAPYEDVLALPAERVLEMATVNGARSLLLEKEIGSISQGKKADLIIINFKKPHLTPSHDVVSDLAELTFGSDVETVIIDGIVVMKDRIIKTVNEEEILKKVNELCPLVLKRAKIKKITPLSRWITI